MAECKHSWEFDGDDPYVRCRYCGRLQDAISGAVVTAPAVQRVDARALLTDALAVLDSVARQDPDAPLPHELRAEVEGLCARIEREREGWT
jgi:hypothetical protein